jgi:hypothetical protein
MALHPSRSGTFTRIGPGSNGQGSKDCENNRGYNTERSAASTACTTESVMSDIDSDEKLVAGGTLGAKWG